MSRVRSPLIAHDGAPRLARPYTMVGGRTQADGAELPIEALVQRSQRGMAALHVTRYERREILALAGEPLSIAELSAHLRVPLGVVRVLVADLAADRLVEVSGAGERPTIDLLERVLERLHAI